MVPHWGRTATSMSATAAASPGRGAMGCSWPIGTPDDYSGGRIERVNIETGKVEVLYSACDGHPLAARTTSCSMPMAASGSPTTASAGPAMWNVAASITPRPMAARSAPPSIRWSPPMAWDCRPMASTVYVTETDTGHIWALDIMAPGHRRPERLAPRPPPPRATGLQGLGLDGGDARRHPAHRLPLHRRHRPRRHQMPSFGFVPLPDPLTTNICFDAEERQAFVTLAAAGWCRQGHDATAMVTAPTHGRSAGVQRLPDPHPNLLFFGKPLGGRRPAWARSPIHSFRSVTVQLRPEVSIQVRPSFSLKACASRQARRP